MHGGFLGPPLLAGTISPLIMGIGDEVDGFP